MEGVARGVGSYKRHLGLLGALLPYKISDTTYYFPAQDITIRYIEGEWLFHMTPISCEHAWEIYSTERYFEEDCDA